MRKSILQVSVVMSLFFCFSVAPASAGKQPKYDSFLQTYFAVERNLDSPAKKSKAKAIQQSVEVAYTRLERIEFYAFVDKKTKELSNLK